MFELRKKLKRARPKSHYTPKGYVGHGASLSFFITFRVHWLSKSFIEPTQPRTRLWFLIPNMSHAQQMLVSFISIRSFFLIFWYYNENIKSYICIYFFFHVRGFKHKSRISTLSGSSTHTTPQDICIIRLLKTK